MFARVCIAGLVGLLVSCAPARPVRRAAVPIPRERPAALDCAVLPGAVGGFEIGDDASLGHAGRRCMGEGHDWTPMDDGGRCSATPLRLPFPATARLVECNHHVCAIQVRFPEFGGETAFRNATASILEDLVGTYGPGVWQLDENMPCPRVEGDEFGCVLDGVGIVDIRWSVADRDDDEPCSSMSATIALRAEGAEAGRTHDGRVSVTYIRQEAAAAFAVGASHL